jgi:hypothetical protein
VTEGEGSRFVCNVRAWLKTSGRQIPENHICENSYLVKPIIFVECNEVHFMTTGNLGSNKTGKRAWNVQKIFIHWNIILKRFLKYGLILRQVTREVHSSFGPSAVYSGGAWFESRLGHRLLTEGFCAFSQYP